MRLRTDTRIGRNHRKGTKRSSARTLPSRSKTGLSSEDEKAKEGLQESTSKALRGTKRGGIPECRSNKRQDGSRIQHNICGDEGAGGEVLHGGEGGESLRCFQGGMGLLRIQETPHKYKTPRWVT